MLTWFFSIFITVKLPYCIRFSLKLWFMPIPMDIITTIDMVPMTMPTTVSAVLAFLLPRFLRPIFIRSLIFI